MRMKLQEMFISCHYLSILRMNDTNIHMLILYKTAYIILAKQLESNRALDTKSFNIWIQLYFRLYFN